MRVDVSMSAFLASRRGRLAKALALPDPILEMPANMKLSED
ncbi:hypothetical protein HC248_01074 [Polaromonas vacuolata]|uniref:Uncharacterized protein n=1 Tax=Polaromonas vacuolata TaxID=37448 RepID=A0A6H2H7D4_9BURK|nr:hypothetical protein HC248_01074 [Polaromonas vacuolata]